MTILILSAVIGVALLGLNIKATVIVVRDTYSEPFQRGAQMLLIWGLPLIGALIVLAVHRTDEKPSRKYRKRDEELDDIEGESSPAGEGAGSGD